MPACGNQQALIKVLKQKSIAEEMELLESYWPRPPKSAYNIFYQRERKLIAQGDLITDSKSYHGKEPLKAPKMRQHSSEGKMKRSSKVNGKIDFQDLARHIARRWKNLDRESKAIFQTYAEQERKEYQQSMIRWTNIAGPVEPLLNFQCRNSSRLSQWLDQETINIPPNSRVLVPKEEGNTLDDACNLVDDIYDLAQSVTGDRLKENYSACHIVMDRDEEA